MQVEVVVLWRKEEGISKIGKEMGV